MEKENKKVTRRKFLEDSSKKALVGTAAVFLGFGMLKPDYANGSCSSCRFCSGCEGTCHGCEGCSGCEGKCQGACTGCEGVTG